jgi:hypothetical protein
MVAECTLATTRVIGLLCATSPAVHEVEPARVAPLGLLLMLACGTPAHTYILRRRLALIQFRSFTVSLVAWLKERVEHRLKLRHCLPSEQAYEC